MSNYNTFERAIARLLNQFPFIKSIAKNSYSRFVYILKKKSYKNESLNSASAFTINSKSSFFGYYDKSPENEIGLTLACSTSTITSQTPSLKHKIDLIVFDQDKNKLMELPLNVHNWQQGCRAQWLDNDLFIYNDFDELSKSYISRVDSVAQNKEVKKFDYPVQDSYKTAYFISLNYQRLITLRPDYGYRNLPNLNNDQLRVINNDGLWKVDYQTGAGNLLITIADVCNLEYDNSFDTATHWLNHVMISPDGSKFIFMHRYLINGRRYDRLILADANTAVMKLLANYGMVSHCYWVNNNTILGYMRGPGNKDTYWLIDINIGKFSELPCKDLAKYGDGHPHVHGDWFITDTYPDKARMQHLLWCNWKTGEVKEVGEFFHGFEYQGESRCDLHPRLSPDGKYVYFDSVFTGQRQLYKMELPN